MPLAHSLIVCLTRQSRHFLSSVWSKGKCRARQSAIWLNYLAHGLSSHISVLVLQSLIAFSCRAKLSRNVSSVNDESKEDWKIRFEKERENAIRAEADLSRRRSSGRFSSQIEQV